MFKSDFSRQETLQMVRQIKGEIVNIVTLHGNDAGQVLAVQLFPCQTIDEQTGMDYRPTVTVKVGVPTTIHIVGRNINPWDLLVSISRFQWGSRVEAYLDGRWVAL